MNIENRKEVEILCKEYRNLENAEKIAAGNYPQIIVKSSIGEEILTGNPILSGMDQVIKTRKEQIQERLKQL